MIKFYEFQAT